MEAWRLMLYSAGVMLVWGVVVWLLDLDVGPIQVAIAFVVAMVAFWAADTLTKKYIDTPPEDS